MSMIPMGGHKISRNRWLVDHYPDAYLNMGLTADRLAQRFGITREAADEFSLRSHQKALAAISAGKFKDEAVPVTVSFTSTGHAAAGGLAPPEGPGPAPPMKREEICFSGGESPPPDTAP